MDNASGNVPNVPPGIEGGKSAELGKRRNDQIMPAAEPESKQMAGMMETMLPRKVAPPRPLPPAETLDNSSKLYSPTPIDRDPPPLSDVKPLSAPVSVNRIPAANQAARPASTPPPRQPAPANSAPAPDRQPTQGPNGTNKPPARPAAATPGVQSRPASHQPAPISGPATPQGSAKSAHVAQPKPAPAARVAPRPGQEPMQNSQPAPAYPQTPASPKAETPTPQLSRPSRPKPAEEMDPNALPEPRLESEPTRKVLVPPSIEEYAPREIKPLLPLESLLAELESDRDPGANLPLHKEIEPEPVEIEEDVSPLLDSPEEEENFSDKSNSLPPLLLNPKVEEIPEVITSLDEEEIPTSVAEEEFPEEEEIEKPKAVFHRETLANDPRITQAVLTVADLRAEAYVKNEFFVSEGAEDPWILPAAATSGLAANHKKRRVIGKINLGVWSSFTTVFFFGSLLVIGAAAIAWSMRGTIGDKIEANLAKKVENAGYFVSYKGWEYDPVRGLVLEGVTVFESAARIIPYAKIDNIGVNTDVFALLKTNDAARLKKTVSFRNSNLILFDQGGEVAHFKGLKGALELDQNRVGLEDLKGQIEGTLFEIEGDVLLRTDSDAVALWNNPAASSSDATSSHGKRRSMTSDFFNLATRKVVLAAQQAQSDSGIEKSLPEPDADAEEESSKPMFAPRTDILIPNPLAKPEPVATEAPPAEEAIQPPVIEVIPSIPSPEPDGSTIPETIEVPAADLISSDPGTPEINSGLSNRKPATLPSLAHLSNVTQYFKIKANGNPPLLTGRLNVDLSDQESPKIKAAGRLTGDSITMRHTIMEGIAFHSVDSPYSYDHQKGLLQLPGFKIGHGSAGLLTGNARYNIPTKVLELSEVSSTIDLPALLTEFDPELKEVLQNIKFFDTPEIHITKGQIPVEDPLGGQIDFSFEQWDGLEFDSAGKKIFINEIRGDFKLAGGVLSIPELKAKVFDGPVDVIGSMRLNDPTYPFNGSIKARGLSMLSIAEYAAIESQYMSGNLNLDYQGVVAKDISKMGGSGRVELHNGLLLKVPVIGPIQRLLGAAIPVFGAENLSSASGNFIIDSGVLMTSDLLVRGDGTAVAVKGQADLARQLTAFSARASLDGPLGFVTGLSNEAIEVDGRGPLFNPQIKLKGGALPAGFSAANAKTILGITDGSAEAIAAMMQEIAGGSVGVGELINGVGGGNRSDQKEDPSSAAQKTDGVLDGIKKGDVKAVSEGLQGLLGGGR